MSSEPFRAVSLHAGWRCSAGVIERIPTGLVHAKQLGTSRTACGLSASSWQVFWALRFPDRSDRAAPTCPDCLAVVAPVHD